MCVYIERDIVYSFWNLSQQLPSLWRSNLDDQTRVNIIRVLDMRVTLYDIRVSALVADGVERLTFSDHIDFITGPVGVIVPSNRVIGETSLSDGTQQDQSQEGYGTVPWGFISYAWRSHKIRWPKQKSTGTIYIYGEEE